MPLDIKAINTVIRTVVANALSINASTVRPANQDAPTGKITEPFITVLVTEIDTMGLDSSRMYDQGNPNELTEVVSGLRRIMVSVQTFRDGAINNAARLTSLLRSAEANWLFNTAGLGLVRVGKITNLSQVVDSFWEERAQLELEFSATSVEQLAVGTFAGVTITVQSEQISVTQEVNLDVTA